MELASCHPSGAWNFEVSLRFLGNPCTPGLLNDYVMRSSLVWGVTVWKGCTNFY